MLLASTHNGRPGLSASPNLGGTSSNVHSLGPPPQQRTAKPIKFTASTLLGPQHILDVRAGPGRTAKDNRRGSRLHPRDKIKQFLANNCNPERIHLMKSTHDVYRSRLTHFLAFCQVKGFTVPFSLAMLKQWAFLLISEDYTSPINYYNSTLQYLLLATTAAGRPILQDSIAFSTINQLYLNAIKLHSKKYTPHKAPLLTRRRFRISGTIRLRTLALICYQLGIRQSSMLATSLIRSQTDGEDTQLHNLTFSIQKIKGTMYGQLTSKVFCNCCPITRAPEFCSLHGPYAFANLADPHISRQDVQDMAEQFAILSHSFRVSLACEIKRAISQSPSLQAIFSTRRINYIFVWAAQHKTTLFNMYSQNYEEFATCEDSLPIFSLARRLSADFFATDFQFHNFARDSQAEALSVLEHFNLSVEELEQIQIAA